MRETNNFINKQIKEIMARISTENIGGGIHRITVEGNEYLPTHVADDIARDVFRRENERETNTWTSSCCGRVGRTVSTPTFNRPTVPNREPDGIDVHVDRPRRENYGGISWVANDAYQRDLAKYRILERVAKDCDWPAREPMKGAPAGSWEAPRTKYIGVDAPSTPRCTRPMANRPVAEHPMFPSDFVLSVLANLI